ncbi:MAG TPA: Gfo/Idh/MocA family oxidoreductase [Planctomycetaceae bacterium]|nr:Gfo/Idh/MocA family oxidoreductase [Planctomycetaceae bacterium]
MNDHPRQDPSQTPSRRDFLKGTAMAAVAGTLAGESGLAPRVFAAGSELLKIGLVGCGGRGSGAASQALHADPHVQLVAMGDAFADKLESSLSGLKNSDVGEKVAVAGDHKFVGFDAYKHVIDSGVDVVLLATPPHFRPAHLQYAVERGKHCFVEKPVAVDGPGVRSMLATCELAKQKRLSIVSGLCWRYHAGMRATFAKVLEGALGNIVAIQATYHTQTLKKFPRKPEWSEMEFQLRNWNGFTWLSGDFNVEQHVHSLDKVAWAMRDEAPLRCTGSGGRQARTGEESGHVYDHFSVVYEYPSGVRAYCSCRQIDGCDNDVSDHIFGTTGTCHINAAAADSEIVSAGKTIWKNRAARGDDMYQTEHTEFFASIRAGSPIHNGDYMAKSTLMGIMGRMSAYSGKAISWEQALNSKESLGPAKYEWGPLPTPSVAVPGVTPFV